MHIQENITNYRIVVYREDLLDIGQTIEELAKNLKEASGLTGKPLGKYTYSYDPKDMSYILFIEKENQI